MTEIIMPKMGLNMSEGLIVEWLAKTGDEIVQGQGIASIESEKVVNNIEAEADGILHIAEEAGETVPVAGVIGYLLAAGEQAPVDTGVRKAIASAMSTSQRDAAEVTLTSEVDCSRLVQARDSGAGKTKVSYNAMLIQLAAAGLKRFPYMNVRLEDEAIVQLEEINVGLAMEAEQGLVVPVVQGADRLSVEQIQEKIQELIEKVQNRSATPDDFQGGTFTVTNLGAYGIDAFTPIINPGQTAILGVGRISERAVVHQGKIEIRPTCVLSLTFDHRQVDGAPAAKFLNALKESVESYS
jgi:pyruvate dehydrogenase E2 component (dihydrolipoamide acetyltransferase)